MYVLHYAPDNASLIVRLVLEAHAIPYRTALVDRSIRAQESAAYRALNPAGLIPTLETPEGPLSETGAILLWLAQVHELPAGPRVPLFKGLFFLSNTLHSDLRQLFYPQLYVPSESIAAHHALITARLLRHFALIEQAAQQTPDLFTPQGIMAPYICSMLRWSVLYPKGQNPWLRLSDFPYLHAITLALEASPAVDIVARAEGLGPTPFSTPHYPQPPEGVAL